MRTSLVALAVSVVAALGLAAVPSSAEEAEPLPPSLAGENLLDSYVPDLYDLVCDPSGTTTVHYSSDGQAAGPYPGTFTEETTVTVGPPERDGYPGEPRPGPVLQFEAEFEIISGDTVVRGTKTFASSAFGGVCIAEETTIGDKTFHAGYFYADLNASYEAVISTPQGDYLDKGMVYASVIHNYYSTPTNYLAGTQAGEAFYDSTGVVPLGPGPAATLTLDPPTATNPVGTSHTVTAAAADTSGDAVDPTPILFTVSGSTTTSGQCTTAEGSCQFTYQGPDLPGADSISACADNNANGTCDVGEPVAEATKAWLLPTSTPGQVTGGGQIPDQSDSNYKIAFGFIAQHKADGTPKGSCSVVDQSPARNIHVRCVDVTALVQSGTHATFFGNATINGLPTTYRIDVDDLGEPGKDRDTFKIQTASGYNAAGTLTQGNVQVHS